jgi:hypothetical protein
VCEYLCVYSTCACVFTQLVVALCLLGDGGMSFVPLPYLPLCHPRVTPPSFLEFLPLPLAATTYLTLCYPLCMYIELTHFLHPCQPSSLGPYDGQLEDHGRSLTQRSRSQQSKPAITAAANVEDTGSVQTPHIVSQLSLSLSLSLSL